MFWDEAILTAAYLYNRVIPSGCKLTPYQSWTGNAPVYKHLRVFGCKAYAVLPTVSRNKDNGKMADNAVDGIMVGYSSNHKAYKIFSQGKIVVSRNVHFDETVFQDANWLSTSSTIQNTFLVFLVELVLLVSLFQNTAWIKGKKWTQKKTNKLYLLT